MVSTPPLAPLPASVEVAEGPAFTFTAHTRVSGDADAAAALRGILRALGAPGGVEADSSAEVALTIGGEGAAESYRLEADANGIRLVAADAAGLFYGVQTLGQLLTPDAAAGTWSVPAVRIADAPRFAYRGVMLDVARHFHPVETVEAYIDRAAALKFNHLHLHLSDDQGWRLQLASRSLLTERSSATSVGGDPGGFFTREDYHRIVSYAAARHMTVVPEIDLPGHTHAVSLAYPELAEDPVLSDHIRDITRTYGGGLPVHGQSYQGMAVGFSSLRIDSDETYAFVGDVLDELAEITPGPYLHIGGDEALGTPADDFARFMSRVTEMVAERGKTPVAWHEAGAATGLAPGTIGQYWGFVTPTGGMDEKTRRFVAGGGQVILSPADAVYLDMKPTPDFPIGLTWARGATSVQRAYEWEPAEVVAGIGDAEILGVEAPLWTETVRDLDDIDALAFPRIAAAAEAGWSPRTGTHPDRTWASFRDRVDGLTGLWTGLGIRVSGIRVTGIGVASAEEGPR